MEIRKLGEFGLIDKIARLASRTPPCIVHGIGDDAAVLRTPRGKYLLVTTDTLTEGVHFETAYTTPELLGKKSIAINLSDIAAMGGAPLCYVVSLSVPPHTPYAFIKKLYQGMRREAQQFGAVLVGGDTSAAKDRISISITLLGAARSDKILYRSGARAGDSLYVTGFLGDAALGLMMLKQRTSRASGHALIKRQLDPTPRVAEGKTISRLGLAHSMIDISDGLLADLRHILDESRVGATLWLSHLPLSSLYKKHCPQFSEDIYAPALCGGEDYELLFTVPQKKKQQMEKWAQTLKIPVTHIGAITGQWGQLIILDEHGNKRSFQREGYTHF